MEEFKNKVVWITGASSGIGEALAYSFAKKGAHLILSGRNEQALALVKQNCLLFTDKCETLSFDMLNIAQFKNIVEQAIALFGNIDYLCNNAGISQRSLIMDTPIEIDRKVMELDYFSQVALTKELLPYFKKQSSGHIIVISSVAGKYGFHYRSAYSAAKHALVGFFETLRLELKEIPVYVTLVYPGRIHTNISINAIKADGTQHGLMDEAQEKGIAADLCAEKIVQAVKRRKVELLIGREELILVYLKRWFPSLYYKFVLKVKPN
jgi:dehydrogenase/reductase SDR family protein 7B